MLDVDFNQYPELKPLESYYNRYMVLSSNPYINDYKELLDKLLEFDHSYEYSDYLPTWRSGEESRKILNAEIDALEVSDEMKAKFRGGLTLHGIEHLRENFEYCEYKALLDKIRLIEKYIALNPNSETIELITAAVNALRPISEYVRSLRLGSVVLYTKAMHNVRANMVNEAIGTPLNLPSKLQVLVNTVFNNFTYEDLKLYSEVAKISCFIDGKLWSLIGSFNVGHYITPKPFAFKMMFVHIGGQELLIPLSRVK